MAIFKLLNSDTTSIQDVPTICTVTAILVMNRCGNNADIKSEESKVVPCRKRKRNLLVKRCKIKPLVKKPSSFVMFCIIKPPWKMVDDSNKVYSTNLFFRLYNIYYDNNN